jgi:hypothetical protein
MIRQVQIALEADAPLNQPANHNSWDHHENQVSVIGRIKFHNFTSIWGKKRILPFQYF